MVSDAFKVYNFLGLMCAFCSWAGLCDHWGEAIDTEEGVYFVRITTQSGEVVGCTGVAISEHMILSAAHCVAVGFVNYDATIEVLLGANHGIENAEYLPVARQYLHPDFQQSDLPAGSDLAILVVDEALPNYRSYREESLPAVSELEAIGYGLGFFDDEAGVSGGVQRKAILSVVEQSDKKIKVGNLEATPCYGDSGAPLFFEDQVVAILSHGIRGCREGMTAVLVAPHFDFLDSVSAQESDLSGG